MITTYDAEKYFDKIAEISYFEYLKEINHHEYLAVKSKEEYSDFLRERFSDTKFVIGIENDVCIGFLAYYENKYEDKIYCYIPVWGYGSCEENRNKVIGMLFQQLAEKLVEKDIVNFNVCLYANDNELQKLFSFMQFGFISEKGIRHIIKKDIQSNFCIKELSKEKLSADWNSVWSMVNEIVNHLKRSPVFYPGKEFTEEVYRDFLTDNATTVYVAKENDRMVGIIESNDENADIFSNNPAVNVGEIYVLPEFRGSSVSRDLLEFVDSSLLKKSIEFEWVQHGTANPNARNYWSKYFDTYEYELVREIKPVL